MGGYGANSGRKKVDFPKSKKQIIQIFPKNDNHSLKDTVENRKLIYDMVNDPKNCLGSGKGGLTEYGKSISNGLQILVKVLDGTIRDTCKIDTPTQWDSEIDPKRKPRNMKNTMTQKQAYYTLYFLLEKYFDSYYKGNGSPDSFDERDLLSKMSTFTFAGQLSINPATKDYFSKIWKKFTKGEVASKEKALEVCLAFVKFYMTKFEFNLEKAVEYLESVDWETVAQKFCALYPTDDMDISNDNPFKKSNVQKELFTDEES